MGSGRNFLRICPENRRVLVKLLTVMARIHCNVAYIVRFMEIPDCMKLSIVTTNHYKF